MKIDVSSEAIEWFMREVRLEPGDKVRFYSKIYGTSPIREGYALGFTVDDDSRNAIVSREVEGITFFINEQDVWFFDGYDLYVGYDSGLDEVKYDYKKGIE